MPELNLTILSKLRPATKKHTPRKSLVGQVFNRLTVYALMGYAQTSQAMSYWLCRCSCGNWSIVAKGKLVNESTKSCGCHRDDIRGDNNRTHGMSKTPAHRRWADMLTRVNNPNTGCAHNYIERGITACGGLRKFEAFYALLGEPPSKQELDRIDNDGNYSCGTCEECLSKNWPMNVHWASKKTNARNRRVTRWITIGGERKSMSEWIEISGVRQSVAWKRLNRGETPEEAFNFKERKRHA